MNNIFFLLHATFDDFRRNKLRTLLTSLGILIGILSVVLLSALGLGLKKYISDQFESLGANLVMILPGRAFQGGMRPGGGMSGGTRFDDKDVNAIKRVNGVVLSVPVFTKYLDVKGPLDTKFTEIVASNENVFSIFNLQSEQGVLFEKKDVEKRAKIAVIGSNISDKLYGIGIQSVGKLIEIDQQNYKIGAVLKKKGGGLGGGSMDDLVLIPLTTAASFNPSKTYIGIYVRADNESEIATVKADVKKALLKRYSEDDFSVADQSELLSVFTSIFGVLNFILMGVAAISLIVGGVGIMNIMYVSVVERIKEIGIRRACGATRGDILSLFLSESMLLSLLGGCMGIFLCFLIVLLVQKIFPAYIDIMTVLVALGVSCGIGVTFGVFPARKAALLTPIEAIRNE